MCPDLNPTAAQEPRLKKIDKIEAYLHDEIEVRERLPNKLKWLSTITSIVDTGLITSTVVNGGVSITAFASSVGLAAGIAVSETNLLFSLKKAITWKSFKIFSVQSLRCN